MTWGAMKSFFRKWLPGVEWLKVWGDILQKWITTFAILAGGIWAYYNFYISDANSENIQIDISTSVIAYDMNNSLLVVEVRPKNIGKVVVTAVGGGFNMSLQRLPGKFSNGHINADNLPFEQKINIDKKYGEYVLEPGVEYKETEGFIVPKGATYLISSQFDLREEEGAEVDTRSFVHVD